MAWPQRIAERIAGQGRIVRITVVRAEGSTPRETGAAMLVGAGWIEKTIGGGALEFEAVAYARRRIADAPDGSAWLRECRDFALGPSLGQCCGGFVRLMFELFTERERPALEALTAADPSQIIARPVAGGVPLSAARLGENCLPAAVERALRSRGEGAQHPGAALIPGRKGEPDWFVEPLAAPATPLIVYGAGHVGRALVHVLEGLPFAVTVVDTDASRLPDPMPQHAQAQITADPAAFARDAPPGAFHIVMTYSHPLDLAICHAVLARDAFGHLGLIGSQTKRARFVKRLRELGIPEASLARLICPIGLPGIKGKQPAVIAIAIAAQLLTLLHSSAPFKS